VAPLCGTLALWACALAASAGCAGYQVGHESLFDPHIRTVYVPVFESDSFRRNLGERLTEAVIKAIEAKTPYKVVGSPDADSVLSGRIVAEGKHVVVENRFDEPRQVEVGFQVQVSWVDRRGRQIQSLQPVALPPQFTTVNATAVVVPEMGQSIATAQQQAIQRVAEQIVGMMETPW